MKHLPNARGYLSEELSAFARLIRDARARCELSREELGQQLDVARQTIGHWENGQGEPNEERWDSIERVLRLTPGSIRAALSPPLVGGSLEYWIGLWEQQAAHFSKLLTEQRALIQLMREKANEPTSSALTQAEVSDDIAAHNRVLDTIERSTEHVNKKRRKSAG